jgi:hypothetical protein
MVLKCPKCNKKFKEKTRYENHRKNIVCDKKYPCLECNHEFTSAANLRRHTNNRITTCAETAELVTHLPLTCKCEKSFTTKSNLSRHQKTCKYKSELEEMRERIEILEKQKSGNTTIINNDNRSINYNIVVLNPYGYEDMEKIDISKVKRLLLEVPDKYILRMIEMIHADPNLLENHNIYYNDIDDEIMVYTKIGNKLVWAPKSQVEAVEELSMKSKRYLKSHPLAQDIPRGSIEEDTYVRNMEQIQNINPNPDVEKIKESLSLVTKIDGFLNMVDIHSTQALIPLN